MATDRELLDELVIASTTLVTVCKNAASVLSAEFEDMITGPTAVVEAILNRCQMPVTQWDGEFREEDCDFVRYTPDVIGVADRHEVGCRGTHRITGDSMAADQKSTFEENKGIVLRALGAKVRRTAARGNH